MSKREEAITFGVEEYTHPREDYIPRKNKSCFFILPLLGYPSYWYSGLINCYLKDILNKPELEGKIFINLKNYDNKVLRIVEFNQFYQLEDKTYMYVFNLPNNFKEDYYKFCEGKYSTLSQEAKSLICKLSGVRVIQDSIVYKVLYKTADQKAVIEELIGELLPLDAEVYSSPNLEREYYSQYFIKSSKIVNEIEKEEGERE